MKETQQQQPNTRETITNEGTRLHNKEELQSYPQTSTVRNYLSYTLVIDTR